MATSLGFPDKKEDGRYAVEDTNGMPVAYLQVKWTGGSFTAETPDGQALCSGKRRSAFSRNMDVYDPSESLLASLRGISWGRKVAVELSGGTELTIEGSWRHRDWVANDKTGRTVLNVTAQASGWSFHPDAYAVTCADDSLDLATFVGVVETFRLILKSRRGASAAAAGSAGAAGSG